ncbi:hypothetical protein AV545_04105 [Paenibacillus jamilae]|uniref:hypothetical protein n=1 Tax=Paenibacillus jamilae TaxID=114136 RepID=UPI0007ABC976|nr:hypothetical protein [Paenibacillus jamilae]KZE65113.1 hypothetical protein AV545_04105 [Paenibacillus jamilae]
MVKHINNLGQGLTTLSLLYLAYAFIIKHAVKNTPDTHEFMGAQISNAFNKNFIESTYHYTVSIPFGFISLAIGIIIVIAIKYFD